MEKLSALIAQGELPTPPVEARRRRRRRMLISPRPGSLFDILHDHAGLQLFVRPLSWTDLHAKLLGCRFVRLPSQETLTPPPSLSPSSSSSPSPPFYASPMTRAEVDSIGTSLDIVMCPDVPEVPRTNMMSHLLRELFPKPFMYPQDHVDLGLRFGSRCYLQAVRCQLLFNPIYPNMNATSFDSSTTWATNQSTSLFLASSTMSASNNPSMLAYVSRSRIDQTRRTCFNIMSGPKGTLNHPVHRLQALRSKSLLPKNANEDSYFLATMVALAQQSVYSDIRSTTGFAPRDVKVHLLTIAEDERAFIVYTGIVPAALLSMFNEPDAAPTGSSDIKIEYVHVPAWPVLGLKERLAKALGSDIIGDAPEHEAAPAPEMNSSISGTKSSIFKSTSSKRKRGIFSEVFNASFSEDRESDRSKDKSEKRRRTQKKRGRVVRSLFNVDEHAVKMG
ncbi:hypothetical protein F5Y12DRAFT_782443 [Xylaria sp. FL1777]|nr:hypothetical protein F5Y12DRAFT_782443 [Xylaria sp. FL1777]